MEKESKIILAQIEDKIRQCNIRGQIQHTHFFAEEEQAKIQQYVNTQKLQNYIWYGGYENAERKMLIVYPEKLEEIAKKEPNLENQIKVIHIVLPNENYGKFEHRNYLGAIMKLGVEREKVGDILVEKEGAYIFIEETIEKFLINQLPNLTRFAKAKIENIPLKEVEIPEKQIQEKTIIVSSMRIDNIVAELAKCSRKIASQYIQQERVFINHEIVKKDSKEVKEKDKITIRGKGRCVIEEKIRNTKKDKIVLKIKYS